MPQSFVCLHYHVVFSTKHRQPMIDAELQPRLYEYMGGIIRSLDGVLLDAGGMPDHVHLYCSIGKQVAISDALREIKSGSSGWVHDTFADRSSFAWQSGYGAFAASYSQSGQIKRYIRNQAEHHRRRTFKEEFIALLERHALSYDERYIWD